MSTYFEIPLTPKQQTFNITLVGVAYKMTVVWNEQNGTWILDIADGNGVLLIGGIALVTGCDLLEQFDYIGFGGKLVVQSDYNPDALPTKTNLGINSHLYFVTP